MLNKIIIGACMLMLLVGCTNRLSIKEDYFFSKDVIDPTIRSIEEDLDVQDCSKICIIHKVYGDSVNDLEIDFENWVFDTKGWEFTVCRPVRDINGSSMYDGTGALLRECCYCK